MEVGLYVSAEPATQVPGDPTRQSLMRRLILALLCFAGWEVGGEKGLEDLKGMWGARALGLGCGEGGYGVHGGEGGHGVQVHGDAGAEVHRVTSAYLQRRNESFVLNL